MNRSIAKPSYYNPDKALILAVLQGALKEFIFPASTYPAYEKKSARLSAEKFLFNDDYRLDWGTAIVSPEELLRMADIELSYVRKRVKEKLKKGVGKHFKGSGSLL